MVLKSQQLLQHPAKAPIAYKRSPIQTQRSSAMAASASCSRQSSAIPANWWQSKKFYKTDDLRWVHQLNLALKVLILTNNDTFPSQNRELQIMRKLEHCNIVKLLYFFYSSGEKVRKGGQVANQVENPFFFWGEVDC